MPATRVQFALTSTTATPPAAPQQPATGTGPAPSSPAVVAVRPVLDPMRRQGSPSVCPAGPSPLRRLLTGLWRLLLGGRIRAGQLTAQDWRVILGPVIALVVAIATYGPQDVTEPPSLLPLGAQITTADRVLDVARTEIGTTEGRGGGTPYHDAYGIADREPWCAVFIWTMFYRVGSADSIGPKTAYTPTMAAWFRARHQWSQTPTVGALVFYDWPDSKHRIQHVEIVESVAANTITTIGGNTGPGGRGSQDDGDGVYRRTRPRDNTIVGYGLPIYGLPAA